ncbi:hypothetical protein BAU08_05690 [Bordetella bronchialis]|uniref:Lcl C-terminal domain-containing protein n=2 Tax=Bordetella bronchialis TaxID=463025 RepID=A0A193G555_9BORD|nr:hypothetical protein BAU08_05690 [Bordetella bronchialis]
MQRLQGLQGLPPAARPHYQVGEYAAGQGGIFAGTILGDDGVTYGLIISEEQDIGRYRWGPDGELDLSEWDGLGNTNRLNNSDHPAAFQAARYEKDGHLDFYLPSRREMMVMLANVPKLFNENSWYWTSTPRSESYAWAVDFEHGNVSYNYRVNEFRVRPVRRFPL